MAKKKFDFSGWATVYGVKCSDKAIIHKDAFKGNDGITVPLVWNHKSSDDPTTVLGHAFLENKEKGVYAYCTFNESDKGKHAKETVRNGDIVALSIYANKIVRQGSDVTHGEIKEVSLVVAGANPGAFIDNVISHGEMVDDAICAFNDAEEITIMEHGNNDTTTEVTTTDPNQENDLEQTDEKTKGKTIQQVFDTFSEKQKNCIYVMLAQLVDVEHSDKNASTTSVEHKETVDKPETLQAVFDTLTEEQKSVAYIMMAAALENKSNKGGNKNTMKQNAFEPTTEENNNQAAATLTHSELMGVIAEAKKGNSLRDCLSSAVIAHGIQGLDQLFPQPKLVTTAPRTLDVDNGWVSVVINGVKHVPFSRIKSMYFDITGEDARAKGYIKGNQKKEEIIALLKRTTSPQTVYKLQKFDRDDVIDIVDFDVVAWIKTEMRQKLNAELARAFLFGDGRSSASDDKISPLNVRPVATDDGVYTIKVPVAGETAAVIAENLVDASVEGQLDYKGNGNIVEFVRADILTKMLLLKDTNKHRLYKSLPELATAMNVDKLVKVPASIMGDLYALALDLSDYNVGADKGGAVNLFDDFDINYNKYEYLIETRCSGALVAPYSAIAFGPASAPSNGSSAQ